MPYQKIKYLLLCFSMLSFSCSKTETSVEKDNGQKEEENATYDALILSHTPIGYWLLDFQSDKDFSENKHHGAYKGPDAEKTELPNGDTSPVFNGHNNYFEIPDADHLEVTSTGVLTVEAWMRPDVYDFSSVEEGKDYIHWMGKGEPGQHSWAARMYNRDSWRENRPQRISGYAFNLGGGLGAGSYFQDNVSTGTWIHFVLIVNTKDTNQKYPTGYTKLYKNGVLRDQDDLKQYDIVPGNGTAPIRIATRDLKSFFEGAIGKVALYNYELEGAKIKAHYEKMIEK